VQLYVHAVSGWLGPYSTSAHVDDSSPENFFLADAGQPITWSTVTTGPSVYEMVQLQNQQLFSENANGQAEWGQYYFATAMVRLLSKDLLLQCSIMTYILAERQCHLRRWSCRHPSQYVYYSREPQYRASVFFEWH
jgi:hypothetical protein